MQQPTDTVDKWKKFSTMMTEAYQELSKKHEALKITSEKDKKIIVALQTQVVLFQDC